MTFHTPVVSHADWSDIRSTTIAAHETPSLIQKIAVSIDTDDDDFVDDAGEPVSAYASPLSLWEMKSGRLREAGPARPRSLWSRIKWGVLDQAADQLGLVSRGLDGTYIHPDLPFMSSKPDMEVSEDQGETWLPMVACNVAGATQDGWRNAVGEWCVPEYMFLHMHHHMAVTGAARGYVVALLGGVVIRTFAVDRDEALIPEIEETVAAFWECVETGRQPRPSGARDAKILSRLNAAIDPTDPVVDLSGDIDFLALVEQRATLSKQAGVIKKEIDELTAAIAERMDGLSGAIISDTQMISRQLIAARAVSYTSKASSKLVVTKRRDNAAGTPLADLAKQKRPKTASRRKSVPEAAAEPTSGAAPAA